MILLLDDEEYSKYNVRILLVGTPTDIRDYFSKVKESQTIVNRTQEVAEVSMLSDPQTKQLLSKGFFDLMGYEIIDNSEKKFNKEIFLNSLAWYSGNIPQFVHELGLHVAIESEDAGRKITHESCLEGILSWLKSSLISEHTTLEKNINSISTKVGRKNQVIYSISTIGFSEFGYQAVEKKLRELFPISTSGKSLNVSGLLSDLSTGDNPILRKTNKGTTYRFIDPKLRIMARWLLDKKTDESLTIRRLDEAIKF